VDGSYFKWLMVYGRFAGFSCDFVRVMKYGLELLVFCRICLFGRYHRFQVPICE